MKAFEIRAHHLEFLYDVLARGADKALNPAKRIEVYSLWEELGLSENGYCQDVLGPSLVTATLVSKRQGKFCEAFSQLDAQADVLLTERRDDICLDTYMGRHCHHWNAVFGDRTTAINFWREAKRLGARLEGTCLPVEIVTDAQAVRRVCEVLYGRER